MVLHHDVVNKVVKVLPDSLPILQLGVDGEGLCLQCLDLSTNVGQCRLKVAQHALHLLGGGGREKEARTQEERECVPFPPPVVCKEVLVVAIQQYY